MTRLLEDPAIVVGLLNQQGLRMHLVVHSEHLLLRLFGSSILVCFFVGHLLLQGLHGELATLDVLTVRLELILDLLHHCLVLLLLHVLDPFLVFCSGGIQLLQPTLGTLGDDHLPLRRRVDGLRRELELGLAHGFQPRPVLLLPSCHLLVQGGLLFCYQLLHASHLKLMDRRYPRTRLDGLLGLSQPVPVGFLLLLEAGGLF
mmetsp:Transcript_148545/g.211022  ORF Transcript_148545/g.211022 Transcript_148545/m.211022 type:complete len:202 (+) Transcript_148545:259-864(+)